MAASVPHDLEFYRAQVEAALDRELPSPETRPAVLHAAIRHAIGAGGKRLRPVICLAVAEATGGRWEDALFPALAIEVLHNYTLVHDDLPAMDNDRERRGQPSVWAKFGEANAILAGDAMLAFAYRLAARAPRRVAEIVDVLGEMGVGVVCGQVEDVALAAGGVSAPADDYVYRHKTADLFIAAAKMGALAVGADAAQVAAAGAFALQLGLAFQYEDDLLDGDGIRDRETTRRLVDETTSAALAALDDFAGDTSFLAALARRLVNRTV